jgi:predicted TIM-barrel fold metal-dependent hydrolase
MKFKIIDSDRHVMEPVEIWQEYADDTIFKKAPVLLQSQSLDNGSEHEQLALPPLITIGNISIFKNWNRDEIIASAYKGQDIQRKLEAGMSPAGQIRAMDASGTEKACLFPSFGMYIVNHKDIDADVSLEYAYAYNRWLKDYCSAEPRRLKPVGIISRHAPENMCDQLQQVIDNGWTTITIRPEVIAGRCLGHQDNEAFWQACEANNIAVAFHGGTNLQALTAGADRFTTRFSLHACSHPMEAQMAFLSLLEFGVLERYPRLKFAFLEAGASWVPHWLWRLDNICYPEFPSLVKKNITMLPSEYFKRQCWVTIELGEPCLRDVINIIGHEKLLYGSDFPHPDHLQFTTDSIASQLPELSEYEIKCLLKSNANDFFGLTDDISVDVRKVNQSMSIEHE